MLFSRLQFSDQTFPVYAVCSLQNQRLEIRNVAAPAEQDAHVQAPPQLQDKTLRELNEMDPYDFAVRKFRFCISSIRLTLYVFPFLTSLPCYVV